jgi:hypothetical protein
MIELVIGKTYKTDDLIILLGISKSTWSRRKDEYLTSLSQAYEYEVTYKGRSVLYTFTKQIGDYQKPENKRSREKNDAVIHKFIKEVIEEDNLQTAANMGRRAFESFAKDVKTEVAELGLKESTVKEYIRLQMREMFGTKINQGGTDGYISEKIWCRLNAEYNVYEELTDEVIKDYYDIVQTVKSEIKKEDVCMFEDYQNGLISREEYGEMLINYNTNLFAEAKKMFSAKYGFYPIKVPRYQLNAWTAEEGKYNKECIN